MAQISIINKSDVIKASRFDAEYYRKEILDRISVLERHHNNELENLVDFIIGPFGSTVKTDQYVDDSKYRYVRNKDINNFVIKDSEPALIPRDLYHTLPKYHIKENDLLITVVGTLGKVAIATKQDTKSIFSCKSTILRVNDINPFYLLTYLNTNIGKLFSLRGKRGAIQEGLNLPDLKEIKVFTPSIDFQVKIEQIVRLSFDNTEESTQSYQEAQQILLSELGLTNWQPKHQLSFIKNYSDVKQAERFDADYFQPMYEEVNYRLEKVGLVCVENICDAVNYGTVPTSPYSEDNSGVPYIKGLNLKGLQIDTNKLDYITKTSHLQDKVFTKEGDIIISQMGTVGNCGVVSKEQENWAFASFTIRIRIADKSKYNPHYIALYIETIAKPYYLLRNIAQASVRQNTDLPTIKRIPIADLKFEKQKQIGDKITKSFALRKQSHQLLEHAKRAVEMAIEQDEQTAIQWLKDQTKAVKG